MRKWVDSFKTLTREQILALPAGRYGDYELLTVCEYFDEINDRDRETAVCELILRSPEVSEIIAYDELYTQVVIYYRLKNNFLKAIQWCFAMMAFGEQHDEGMNRLNHRLDLANIHMAREDLNLGLAMYARMLHADPGNRWLYYNLGLALAGTETLEKGSKLAAQSEQYRLKDDMEDLVGKAVELISSNPSRLEEVDPDVLVNIQEALHLPEEADLDHELYAPPIAQLLEINSEQGETAYVEAYAEIIAGGQLYIPSLIQLAYESDSENGAGHAIAILRTLKERFPQELRLLTPWLDQAEGNWHLELLSRGMGKIGGYTTKALREFAADTNYDTNIRSSATGALVERTQQFPELRYETIAFFRTLLTRSEAYQASEEEFIAMLIWDSLDLGARELYPDIRQVFDEDRLEPGFVDLNEIHRKWEMPILPIQREQDGLYLPLKCKECDRTREHFTKYVLVDVDSLENGGPESKYDAHILDHEVICPKCGAVDRYEMTSIAHLRMSGSDDIVEMFKSEADKKTKRLKPNPRVLYFRSIVFGENMHPLDGLDEYRRQIAISPDDALLHSKMGSLLRMLMRYPEALEAQRYAYRLAPDNSEVIIRLAVSEHDFGDEETAAKLYQKIVDLSSAKKKFSSIDENTILAIKGIKNLKLNKPSPNEVIVATRDGEPVVHPSTHVRRFQAKPPAITSRGSKTKRGRRGRRRK